MGRTFARRLQIARGRGDKAGLVERGGHCGHHARCLRAGAGRRRCPLRFGRSQALARRPGVVGDDIDHVIAADHAGHAGHRTRRSFVDPRQFAAENGRHADCGVFHPRHNDIDTEFRLAARLGIAIEPAV